MDNPSNKDIYLAIGRLEGKFDVYMDIDLPKRVSSLERTRAWMAGVVAVVSATAISFATFLRDGA